MRESEGVLRVLLAFFLPLAPFLLCVLPTLRWLALAERAAHWACVAEERAEERARLRGGGGGDSGDSGDDGGALPPAPRSSFRENLRRRASGQLAFVLEPSNAPAPAC
jgi:hypothetical protein